MRGAEGKEWSDSEAQPVLKPRGRPRKSVPQQAAATSEEPAKGVLGKGPGGQRKALDQDFKQTSETDFEAYKRQRSAAEDEVASAGLDADTEQEHLPAKRRRTPLFSIQDIIAAEKGDGTEDKSAAQMNYLQQQQQQGGLPPTSTSSRPGSRQQQLQQLYDQDWAALLQQQQQQQYQQQQPGRYSGQQSPAAAAVEPAAAVELAGPAAPGSTVASPAAAAASAGPPFQQESPTVAHMQPAAAAVGPTGAYGSSYGAIDPAGAAAAAAAAIPSVEDVQQQQRYASQQPQPQQQRPPPPVEFNPDVLPKGAQRDMALQRERRLLAETAQQELGPDSLGPDTNVATLVQRILKCGVLTRKTVEYRKRAKGLVPADYNRGTITSAGLIRCSCHGQDITMSEFEQHSNSQIHRPAEYIFIKCIDMSLKTFANLVLQKPIESNLWYCLACNEGGDLLCCDGCPAAFHTACLGHQAPPQPNQEWLCSDCLLAGKKPRWSASGPLRRQVPLAGAAGPAGGAGGGTSSSMRRTGSGAGGGRSAARGSSSDGARKGGGAYSGGGLYGAAAAAAAAVPSSSSGGGGGYGHQAGFSYSAAQPSHAYYESDEPHMAAAAGAAGMSSMYSGMTNPATGSGVSPHPASGAQWCGRTQSQGLAGLPGVSEPQGLYPIGAGFSSQQADTRSGFSGGGYDQGYGSGFMAHPGAVNSLPQGSAGLSQVGLSGADLSQQQGLVGSGQQQGAWGSGGQQQQGYGGYGVDPKGTAGTGPVKREPVTSLYGQAAASHQQQQQPQVGIEQLLHSIVGGNSDLLQMLQKHLQPQHADQQQQQQQHNDIRAPGIQTPPAFAGMGSGAQQQRQQFGSPYDQQQQQQQGLVVARKGSSTLDPAAAAAAPVAQLPVLPSAASPQQQSDLAALAAAAAAEAAGSPAQQQQQQHPPVSADNVTAAATAAQLYAHALKAAEGGTASDIIAKVLDMTKHMQQQQQQPLPVQPAAAPGGDQIATALLQMVAAAVGASTGQQQQPQQQQQHLDVLQPQAHVAPPMAAAAGQQPTAAADEAETTASGVGEGQPPAAVAPAVAPAPAGPEPMDQDADSPGAATAAAAAKAAAAAAVARSWRQQQQGPSGERRAAVAAALQAGSSLVSNVLGAQSLSEAQRAVAAAGAQMLEALGGLL